MKKHILIISLILLLCLSGCTANTNEKNTTNDNLPSTDNITETSENSTSFEGSNETSDVSQTVESTLNSNENINISGTICNTIYTNSPFKNPFIYTEDNSKFSSDMFYALSGLSFDVVYEMQELVDGQPISAERDVSWFNEYFLIPKTVESGKTQDFEYTVREGGFAEITKCLNNSEHIEIPSSVNGYPVLYIGNETFKNSTVKEVILPESIIAVGEQAFYSAGNLTSINFPKSLISVSSYAFRDCINLKNVVFNENLKIIGENAFENCTSIETINIPASLVKIHNYAFKNCEKLNCSLNFSSDFYEIMSGAFENTAITSVEFSDGLYTTGAGVFSGCSKLKKVVFPSEIGDSENGIGWGSFMGCSSLEEVNIPENLIGIMSDMFNGCTSLKSIKIPAAVEFLNSDVFTGCNNLKDIYFDGADCSIYYNSFIFSRDITVHAPKGGSVERFFMLRPLIKFVPTT